MELIYFIPANIISLIVMRLYMNDQSMSPIDNSQNPTLKTFADDEIIGFFNLMNLGTEEERDYFSFLYSQTIKQSNSQIGTILSNNSIGGEHAKLEFNP
jgi:hypothetical protein